MDLVTSKFIRVEILIKVQEIGYYMKNLPKTGIRSFIRTSKECIDSFTPSSDINVLYNALVVLLHAISDVISNLDPADKNYQLLSAFHDDYIFPRYQSVREIISMKKSYFERFNKEEE